MENNNLWIISIVAIVAIVGMVFMFSGNKVSYAQQGANYIYEDAEGDLAGQAITRLVKKPVNITPTNETPMYAYIATCVDGTIIEGSGDLEGVAEYVTNMCSTHKGVKSLAFIADE